MKVTHKPISHLFPWITYKNKVGAKNERQANRIRRATLLKTLNSLICEEGILTTEQRQNMVMTVATQGALGERVRQSIEDKAARAEKKPRDPDPIFPKAGTPWREDDDELLRTLIDGIPDEELFHHIRWLSEKLGRTPHAIALRIVNEGRMDGEWSKTFRPLAQMIRDEAAAANGVATPEPAFNTTVHEQTQPA